MKNSKNLLILFIALLLLFIFSTSSQSFGQKLLPGFDKAEYIELLKISASQRDSAYNRKFPSPETFTVKYRSPVKGLDNRWDLWINEDSVAVISIRGTTRSAVSWLENIYGVMVPASGELKLTDDFFLIITWLTIPGRQFTWDGS